MIAPRPLALLVALGAASPAGAQEIPVHPTDDGHAVLRVVQAQPFKLVEGTFEVDFSAEGLALRHGTLVVIAVDPVFARPRDARMPVLYVGARPVQIVTQDVPTGCVVGLLGPDIDLARDPVFFGSTEPPERVDRARGAAERAAAEAAGFKPRTAAELARAQVAAVLSARDAAALVAEAKGRADLCR